RGRAALPLGAIRVAVALVAALEIDAAVERLAAGVVGAGPLLGCLAHGAAAGEDDAAGVAGAVARRHALGDAIALRADQRRIAIAVHHTLPRQRPTAPLAGGNAGDQQRGQRHRAPGAPKSEARQRTTMSKKSAFGLAGGGRTTTRAVTEAVPVRARSAAMISTIVLAL